jgi:hypothetical protein
MMKTYASCVLLIAWLGAPALLNAEMDREALEAWFFDDEDMASVRALAVNEGELTFLTRPPQDTPHHHQNTLYITPESLNSGWVALTQCHENLDAVGQLQITFRKGRIRNLQVTEHQQIDQAWAEEASIQLRGVNKNARLCLSAESKILQPQGDNTVLISNGPYMRKYLDGYYPMRVSMQIHYPQEQLEMLGISPQQQDGFQVTDSKGVLQFDTLFEGELRTQITMQTR